MQGGCAISKSHFPTSCVCPSIVVTIPPSTASRASPRMCHSGCPPLGSCISHEYDSNPRSRNARHTRCDSSHATRTLILDGSFIVCPSFPSIFAPQFWQYLILRCQHGLFPQRRFRPMRGFHLLAASFPPLSAPFPFSARSPTPVSNSRSPAEPVHLAAPVS